MLVKFSDQSQTATLKFKSGKYLIYFMEFGKIVEQVVLNSRKEAFALLGSLGGYVETGF